MLVICFLDHFSPDKLKKVFIDIGNRGRWRTVLTLVHLDTN